MSINRRMDKEVVEYYSTTDRNEFQSVLVRWMSLEPVIQSDISQKEKNKYCTITCVCGIYKNGTDEPICRAAMDSQTQRADLWTWGRQAGEGGMKGESNMEIYTLTYVKQISSGNLLYDSGKSNQISVTIQRYVGERLKKKGTYVYLWLIHVIVWQKSTHYKAIILQSK